MDDMRIQFCRGDDDITSDITAERDATEVRVWSSDPGCEAVVVAIGRDGSGRWTYQASDYTPEPSWPVDDAFDSWEAALEAFGVDTTALR